MACYSTSQPAKDSARQSFGPPLDLKLNRDAPYDWVVGELHLLRVLVVVAAAMLCSGCAVQIVERQPVGLVVSRDLDAAQVSAAAVDQRTTTVGAWIGLGGRAVESLGLGYRRSHRLQVPADCRLVIVVPSEAMLKRVQESGVIEKGTNACAISEPQPSPP